MILEEKLKVKNLEIIKKGLKENALFLLRSIDIYLRRFCNIRNR
jgi:hypothetical protein